MGLQVCIRSQTARGKLTTWTMLSPSWGMAQVHMATTTGSSSKFDCRALIGVHRPDSRTQDWWAAHSNAATRSRVNLTLTTYGVALLTVDHTAHEHALHSLNSAVQSTYAASCTSDLICKSAQALLRCMHAERLMPLQELLVNILGQ